MLLAIFYLFLGLPICWTNNQICSRQHGCHDIAVHLQPNEVPEFDNKTCTRECNGGPPRTCFYKFYLEEYKTLSQACGNCTSKASDCYKVACVPADGYEKGFLSVNRRLPGPSVQVCRGDRVVVDVLNRTPGQGTSIHWHGQWQKGTQYNDGVPMITQCPILENTYFRYDFHANNDGTFFYHSHIGHQMIDGWQGPLIVRSGKQDTNAYLYDQDLPQHVIFLHDWYHLDAGQHYPGLRTHSEGQDPSYLLINGLGKYIMGNDTVSSTPFKVFNVTSGVKYRFRLIGGLSQCPVIFCIEGHTLLAIATDGNAIKPVEVSCITVHTGERYDFVLNANNEKRAYWMQLMSTNNCEDAADPQFAVLMYDGADLKPELPPFDEPLEMNGVVLNPINHTQSQGITVDQLETADYLPKAMRIRSSYRRVIPIVFGYYFPDTIFCENCYHSYIDPKGIPLYFWVNNITNTEPPSPIISQLRDIPPSAYCHRGSDGQPNCNTTGKPCDCLNIIRVPLQRVVNFILIDRSNSGGINHPFHLHGHVFNVIAMGQTLPGGVTVENIKKHLQSGSFRKSNAPAAFKDTIAVPSGGFAVIGMLADNPGYWMLHCHILSHTLLGMGVVIQVGTPSDLPPIPSGFPRCMSFQNFHF